MRILAVVFSLIALAAAGISAARAGDAETIDAINQAAAKLDKAFEQQDAATIKQLMTPDHVAVTPYYDGPQSVDDQIASLPDLKYEQTNLGEVAVALLGPDLAQRSFSAELDGAFKGRPFLRQVFVSELWVKGDGGWQEKFYQVTAMRHGGRHGACRGVAGTYLTRNVMKGGSADSFTSRSLITLGRGGLVLFTDSGEGGEAGFAPFTEGRGAWRCQPFGEIGATTLDFTVPTASKSHAEIGRLDFKLTYDAAGQTLRGAATLYLIPLGQDPLAAGELKDGRQFEITGQRVAAP
jgi:ketosteroid isomerase-like protein